MTGLMSKLNEHKWSVVALAVMVGGLLLSRGGLASLLPLLRILVPVVVVIAVLKFIQKKIGGAAGEALRKRMEEAMRQQQGGGKVIDLCPRCGAYQAAGHRCKS